MLRENRRLFLWMAIAGLALRVFFFVWFPMITDDSRVYMDIATNWLRHGVYGQTELAQIVPVDTRLPGYPAFLAAIFWAFRSTNFRAVLASQILVDLGTCLLIADLARRMAGQRAAKVAFALAALCPFLANYTAALLTETLEIFFTALALDFAAAALGTGETPARTRKSELQLWALAGASIGACILIRPDGGILLPAAALFLIFALRRRGVTTLVVAEVTLLALALAPLVPWTIRNFRTMHHFQPLAPRYANTSDELAPHGFNRWVTTWMADYVSVEEIYWNVPGDKIDVSKLPSRALDDPTREKTLALIADYNESQDLTADLDARFGELAAERIRAHPIRSRIVLPAVRVADMWLRPRTEILSSDVRWWEFNDDPRGSALAVGFGVLNLLYLGAALAAVLAMTGLTMTGRTTPKYTGLLLAFLVLRTLFLATIENPEPRYTLECYPAVIALAAAFVARSPRLQAIS